MIEELVFHPLVCNKNNNKKNKKKKKKIASNLQVFLGNLLPLGGLAN